MKYQEDGPETKGSIKKLGTIKGNILKMLMKINKKLVRN